MEIGEIGQLLDLVVSHVEEGIKHALAIVTIHLLLLEDLPVKELNLSHNYATIVPAQAS